MRAQDTIRDAGIGTFWMLFGQSGATMTIEQLRDACFPSNKIKTMANKHSAGLLPPRTGDVYDTRDVAAWWTHNAGSRLIKKEGRLLGGLLVSM